MVPRPGSGVELGPMKPEEQWPGPSSHDPACARAAWGPWPPQGCPRRWWRATRVVPSGGQYSGDRPPSLCSILARLS